MNHSHRPSKSLYSSTPQSKMPSSRLDDRLSELSTLKSDLIRQKQIVDSLKPFSDPSTAPAAELKIKLKLEQDQNDLMKKTLSTEREKSRSIEKELDNCKSIIKELEHKNRHAQASLIEKDRVLSRYICEMLILKQEVEKLVNPSSPICKNLQKSLKILNLNEPKYELSQLEIQEYQIAGSLGKSQKYYESEIARLQKQLNETQDLYKLTNHQLKDLIEKTAKQDSDYLTLQHRLNAMKLDFSETASAITRTSSEKDFHAKSLIVELDDLRKKRDDQDIEINRLEKRYKASINELKEDLSRSREKILEVIEAKTQQEKENFNIKQENKDLGKDLHFKDLKISDLSAQIASLNQELKILKNAVKSKPVDSMDSKVRQKYEGKIQELNQKNDLLAAKVQQLEQDRQRNSVDSSSASKVIVSQLTNIILSRDKLGNTDRHDANRNLCKFLIENHEVFEGILVDYFGKSYETLREIMQEKLEEMVVLNEELLKENTLISEQLKLESSKRIEVFDQLQELESEVRKKHKENLTPEPRSLRRVLDFESDSEEDTKASSDKNDFISFIKCQAALIETCLEVGDENDEQQ